MGVSYNVPLIPQSRPTSCWAAAMAMIVSYGEQASYTDDSIAQAVGLSLDSSYGWNMIYRAAQQFNFQSIPSACYTGDAWVGYLQRYGPIWLVETGNPSHAVVVTGGDGSTFNLNNPWPPNMGKKETKSIDQLSQDFEGAAGAVGNNSQLMYRQRQ